ncbi:hypothetical protein BMS3Abin16_00001 [archaeon BMS3Abin16]|nr:hypothetical protein BMS3Abin16_00001 [archaeon BMS3Abin16]
MPISLGNRSEHNLRDLHATADNNHPLPIYLIKRPVGLQQADAGNTADLFDKLVAVSHIFKLQIYLGFIFMDELLNKCDVYIMGCDDG